MLNVCQIPKRSYIATPPSSLPHPPPPPPIPPVRVLRSIVELRVDRKQTVNIAKPLQLRARYFYFATLILPRTAISIPRRMYSRFKLFPPCSISVSRVRRKCPKCFVKEKGIKNLIIK